MHSKNQSIIFNDKEVLVRSKGCANIINLSNILLIYSSARKIFILTDDNKEIHVYGKMDYLENVIPKNFLRIHCSFIINKNFVMEKHYEYVVLKNNKIYNISKRYRKNLKLAL